jgi:hypothetical protein
MRIALWLINIGQSRPCVNVNGGSGSAVGGAILVYTLFRISGSREVISFLETSAVNALPLFSLCRAFKSGKWFHTPFWNPARYNLNGPL